MIFRKNHISKRGLSAVEVLIAVAISMAFLSSAVVAFLQISVATQEAERRMKAINNGRAAFQLISRDMAKAKIDVQDPQKSFTGINVPLAEGDRRDNDGDGLFDEEQPDGLDQDGDFIDRHAQIGVRYERPLHVGIPDLGDIGVDEDNVFHNDRLRFFTALDSGNQVALDREINYYIDTFDGEDNVLIRRIDFNVGNNPTPEIITEPLAFDVLSVNFLFFDQNRLGQTNLNSVGPNWPPNWVEDWDSTDVANFELPRQEMPIAVYVALTIYSGDIPLNELAPGAPLQTTTMSTIITLEQVKNDFRYDIVKGHY